MYNNFYSWECGTVSVVESITHATCGRSGIYGISITYALSGNSQNSVCTIKLFIFIFQIFNFTFHFHLQISLPLSWMEQTNKYLLHLNRAQLLRYFLIAKIILRKKMNLTYYNYQSFSWNVAGGKTYAMTATIASVIIVGMDVNHVSCDYSWTSSTINYSPGIFFLLKSKQCQFGYTKF